jgi:hypothetical protein
MFNSRRTLMVAATSLLAIVRAVAAQPAPAPAESAEAAKVAAWVKAALPVEAEEARFAVIGGVSLVHIGGAATDLIRSSGPSALYRDSGRLAQARQSLESRTRSREARRTSV